jgi:hypothetical protein
MAKTAPVKFEATGEAPTEVEEATGNVAALPPRPPSIPITAASNPDPPKKVAHFYELSWFEILSNRSKFYVY